MRTSELVNNFMASENSPLALAAIQAAAAFEDYLPSDNSIMALAGIISDLGLELTGISE